MDPQPAPTLSAETLLNAWEQALAQPPLERALTLLAAARPHWSAAQWAQVALGERDKVLLELREELFGSRLNAVGTCPQCGEKLDLDFTTADVRAESLVAPGALRATAAGYTMQCRLPTTADLLLATRSGGRALLLQRCVEAQHESGAEVDPAALPEEAITAVARLMAEADAQADVRIATTCPACTHAWSSPFDILSYLWSEIEEWVGRLLRDVHTLASTYGWSEQAILGMSARRRRLYLEQIQG